MVKASVKYGTRVRNFRAALDMDQQAAGVMVLAVDNLFMKLERQVFASEGRSEGLFWAPLSPEYKRRKDAWFAGQREKWAKRKQAARMMGVPDRMAPKDSLRGFATNKILQLTGGMKTGLTRYGGDHVRRVTWTPDVVTASVGAEGRSGRLAAIHGEGGMRLPLRSVAKFSDAHRAQFVEDAKAALIPWVVSRLRALYRINMKAARDVASRYWA